jgi:hypothetical protein
MPDRLFNWDDFWLAAYVRAREEDGATPAQAAAQADREIEEELGLRPVEDL